jgi:protease-4
MKSHFLRSLIKRVIVIIISVHTVIISIFTAFLLVVVIAAIIAVGGEGSDSLEYQTIEGDEFSNNKILSIPVTGVILGDTSESPSSLPFLAEGVTFGYQVKDELAKAAKDEDIQGVVLEINSPGGTIYGSRAIADGVSEYKKATGNPVYVFISGLAASGGYMAAVTSDEIYADYGSTIGSVGVIYGPIKFYDNVLAEGGLFEGEVLTQNGIESFYISAGKSKDLGNPYRQITTEERSSLQAMVNSEYSAFVNFVSSNREIGQDQLRNTIGALIYSNESAKTLKLIDDTKNKQQTYKLLADKKQLSEYQIVQKIPSYGFFETLLFGSGLVKHTMNSCMVTESMLVYHGDISTLCGNYSK